MMQISQIKYWNFDEYQHVKHYTNQNIKIDIVNMHSSILITFYTYFYLLLKNFLYAGLYIVH